MERDYSLLIFLDKQNTICIVGKDFAKQTFMHAQGTIPTLLEEQARVKPSECAIAVKMCGDKQAVTKQKRSAKQAISQ